MQARLCARLNTAFRQSLNPQMQAVFGPRLHAQSHSKPRAGVPVKPSQAFGESPVVAQGNESMKSFLADTRTNLVAINSDL